MRAGEGVSRGMGTGQPGLDRDNPKAGLLWFVCLKHHGLQSTFKNMISFDLPGSPSRPNHLHPSDEESKAHATERHPRTGS